MLDRDAPQPAGYTEGFPLLPVWGCIPLHQMVSIKKLLVSWLVDMKKIVHIQKYKINYPSIYSCYIELFLKNLKSIRSTTYNPDFIFIKVCNMCICCVAVWCVRKHLTERRVIWTGCLRRTGSGSENYSKTTARTCPQSYRGVCTSPVM